MYLSFTIQVYARSFARVFLFGDVKHSNRGDDTAVEVAVFLSRKIEDNGARRHDTSDR